MAKYFHSDSKNSRAAKERLKKALARVKLAMEASDTDKTKQMTSETYSAMGHAVKPHIRKNSMKALHVYQGELGGWYADIELRGMPPGIPKIMGNPAAMPFETKAEAEASGDLLVQGILIMARENEQASNQTSDSAIFEFYDVEFPMPLELVSKYINDLGKPYKELVVRAIQTLEELLVVDGKVVTSRLNSDSEDFNALVMSSVMILVADGMPRWPVRKEVRPKKNTRH